MRKTKLYAFAVDYLRSRGLKVRHRKMSILNGSYNSDTKIIEISYDLKGTVLGVYVAFHEFRHYIQDIENIFPHFNNGYNKYRNEYMEEIVMAERDAAKFSQKMMAGLGLKFKPYELDDKELPELKIFWRKHYFPPEKKKRSHS